MKTLIITALLTVLTYGSTLSTAPFGLNLSKDVTIVDLWNNLGAPDTIGIFGDSTTGNLIYRKDNLICYLLITDLYSIVIKEGKFENIEIGMKMRKITRKLKKLGKVTLQNFPTRQFLEYKYANKYILSLEFKNKKSRKRNLRKNRKRNLKLTKIHIMKNI